MLLSLRRLRSKSAGYREMRKKLRKHKRELAFRSLREHARRNNILVGVVFAVGGVLVYCGWGALEDVDVDLIGLLLAAVVPPFAYVVFILLWGYWRARVLAYGEYRAPHDAANPPSPWKASSEVMPSDEGPRIALRLHLSRQYTAVEAEEVSCTLYASEDFHLGFKVKEPIRDVRLATDTGSSVAPPPIEFIYPDDFDNPQWPLDPGKYPVSWELIEHGKSTGAQHTVKIKKRQA